MGRRRLLTLLVTTILVAAACGGPSEDEAIAAITSAFTDHMLQNVKNATLSAEEATCVAEDIVDDLGAGVAEEYGLLAGDGDVQDLDIHDMTFSTRHANVISDTIIRCMDLRQSVLDRLERMAPGHERFQNCISASVNWQLLSQAVSLELQGADEESGAASEDLTAGAEAHADECLRTAVGSTNPLVLAYESHLLDLIPDITENQANCVAIGAFDILGETRMKQFSEDPGFNLRSAEAQAFAETLTTCLEFRESFLAELADDGERPSMIDCVDEHVNYELFVDFMLAVIDGTASEVSIAETAIDRSIDRAFDTCTELLDDTTSA